MDNLIDSSDSEDYNSDEDMFCEIISKEYEKYGDIQREWWDTEQYELDGFICYRREFDEKFNNLKYIPNIVNKEFQENKYIYHNQKFSYDWVLKNYSKFVDIMTEKAYFMNMPELEEYYMFSRSLHDFLSQSNKYEKIRLTNMRKLLEYKQNTPFLTEDSAKRTLLYERINGSYD